MSEPVNNVENNKYTDPKIDEATMQEVLAKTNDLMSHLSSIKTATDLDDAIKQIRQVLSDKIEGVDFPISDRKKKQEFVASMYWSWILQFAEHTIDPHYELDLLIRTLERLKRKLPKINEILYQRANKLRAEGKRWPDVYPYLIEGWEGMDGAARKLASDDFRKANNQFNSRQEIAVKANDMKKKAR